MADNPQMRKLWAVYHGQRYANKDGFLAAKINQALARSGLVQELIANRFASGGGSGRAPAPSRYPTGSVAMRPIHLLQRRAYRPAV